MFAIPFYQIEYNTLHASLQPTHSITHCQVYLVSAMILFSLPKFGNIFVGTFDVVTSPLMSPLAHIGMVGSNNLSVPPSVSCGRLAQSTPRWPSLWRGSSLLSTHSLSLGASLF